MKLFAKALEAMNNASAQDSAYCASLAKRFEAMGISSAQASDAICTLIEKEAVPQVGVWAATPSMFNIKTEAAPATQGDYELQGALS